MSAKQETLGTAERGVYVDDVTFDGYVGYKIVGSDGRLLLRSCIMKTHVDASTEGLFWKWLSIYDPTDGGRTILKIASLVAWLAVLPVSASGLV